MKRLCEWYMRRALWIGAAFCAAPSLGWFVGTVATNPFRGVYVLRLAFCLTVGAAVAGYLNDLGMKLWLAKHRGGEGPATVLDGALVGAAIGVGSALLPALTALFRTHHLELAKTFVIAGYLSCALAGVVLGSVLAVVGRRYVDRPGASS